MVTVIFFTAVLGLGGGNFLPTDPVPWKANIVPGIVGGIFCGLLLSWSIGREQLVPIGLSAVAGGRIACQIVRIARSGTSAK